ncbi:MAG: NADH-quinone oxidoreductase subunit C [Thermodesulfovibrionales bacterium]|nr:NADH-quinone oxidoreductase subunit C [Thermodesulfovibrionales bacterium]
MEPQEIAEKIKERFPDEVIDITSFRDQVSVIAKKERIVDICRYLHDDPHLHFDFLVDLCGVDYLDKKVPRFEVVYNLYSIKYRHRIRLKAQVPEDNPRIDTVTSMWAGANWHERECFDMYGIVFRGHPDLRRILMPEDWEGYPLRKDYPVKGPEKEWPGFQEVLDKAKAFREFEWKK